MLSVLDRDYGIAPSQSDYGRCVWTLNIGAGKGRKAWDLDRGDLFSIDDLLMNEREERD